MNVSRLFVMGAAVVLILAVGSVAAAADDNGIRLQSLVQEAQVQVRPLGAGGVLLAPTAIEKLKFTAEQKEKFAKIEAEFKEKQKAASEKFQEAYKSGDRAKIKEASEKFRTDSEALRNESLGKVAAMLTDEQKKTFEEVKKEQPRFNVVPLPGRPVPQPAGQVLPPAIQEKLKLTDEQKKKIEELQKELESKIIGVLTEEQKKQYDELKKQTLAPVPGIRLVPGNK
jgi:Spy/CpxP family protein refolding chaperone